MERLTFEGNFCDICMCQGQYRMTSECADGDCYQKKVWDRLKEYEDTGLEPEEIEKAMDAFREQEIKGVEIDTVKPRTNADKIRAMPDADLEGVMNAEK